MSMRDQVKFRCDEGRLRKLVLDPSGAREKRMMYVSPDINRFLLGPWANIALEDRAGALAANLAWFVEGGLITVPKNSLKAKTAYMSLLRPPVEEVWEIRSRDPRPAIRIVGRFAEKDVFIALTWCWRNDLKDISTPEGVRLWKDAKLRCRVDWRNLFPAYEPLTGRYPNDYLSNAVTN